jgi:hypothetical protein
MGLNIELITYDDWIEDAETLLSLQCHNNTLQEKNYELIIDRFMGKAKITVKVEFL